MNIKNIKTGKIIRVTLEYEKVTYIAEGKEAESWQRKVGDAATMLFIHGDKKGWNSWTRIEKKGL